MATIPLYEALLTTWEHLTVTHTHNSLGLPDSLLKICTYNTCTTIKCYFSLWDLTYNVLSMAGYFMHIYMHVYLTVPCRLHDKCMYLT